MNTIHRPAFIFSLATVAALAHLVFFWMGLNDPEVASTCFTFDALVGMLMLALLCGEPNLPD